MIRALYTAASGMSAEQLNLDTIANNLSNSGTVGFRSKRLQFQDMIYQNLITPGAAQSAQTVSAGLQVGLGTRSTESETILTQGDSTRPITRSTWRSRETDFFRSSFPTGRSTTRAPAISSSTIKAKWWMSTATCCCRQ